MRYNVTHFSQQSYDDLRAKQDMTPTGNFRRPTVEELLDESIMLVRLPVSTEEHPFRIFDPHPRRKK